MSLGVKCHMPISRQMSLASIVTTSNRHQRSGLKSLGDKRPRRQTAWIRQVLFWIFNPFEAKLYLNTRKMGQPNCIERDFLAQFLGVIHCVLTLYINFEDQAHCVSCVDLTLIEGIVFLQHRVNLQDPSVGSTFNTNSSIGSEYSCTGTQHHRMSGFFDPRYLENCIMYITYLASILGFSIWMILNLQIKSPQ